MYLTAEDLMKKARDCAAAAKAFSGHGNYTDSQRLIDEGMFALHLRDTVLAKGPDACVKKEEYDKAVHEGMPTKLNRR